MTSPTLSDLIERVEAASEGSRELDCEIGVAIGWFRTEPNKGWPEKVDYIDIRGDEPRHPGHGLDQLVPRYAASIDAAITIIPAGWTLFHLGGPFNDSPCHATVGGGSNVALREGASATPALALVAASLKARLVGGEK